MGSALLLWFLFPTDLIRDMAPLTLVLYLVCVLMTGAGLGACAGALSHRFGALRPSMIGRSSMTSVLVFRVLVILLGSALLVAAVFGVAFIRSRWDQIQQPQAVLGAGICAVLAASLAFVAAVANAVETGASRVQTHAREIERGLHERYSEAADQLGDKESTFAKRVGGAYALAAVADDWLVYDPHRTFEAEVAVDLMCAYLRANTATDLSEDREKRGEEAVRDALIVLLREHTYLPDFRKRERKVGRPWPTPDVSFNLNNADLTRVVWKNLRLHGIQLLSADLTDAELNSSELNDGDLTGAIFVDADLTGCNLTGVPMEDCDLRGADLTDAHLSTEQVTDVYSGTSPSGKDTIWPKNITPPPPRSPDAISGPPSEQQPST